MKITALLFSVLLCCAACTERQNTSQNQETETVTTDSITAEIAEDEYLPKQQLTAPQTDEKINIDGKANEDIWAKAEWQPLDQLWIGEMPDAQDFQGRYKIAWSEDMLLVLAEITDDTLTDIHADGLKNYWDDDCLEIFVDEDASGGNHQYSHNAFAYHLSLDGKAVDISPDTVFTYYNDHVRQARTQQGHLSVWEVGVKIFDDTYRDGAQNTPVKLAKGKKMGFALAYCDNDRSPEREHFMGSVYVPGEDKNQGWKDAGIFGELTLE